MSSSPAQPKSTRKRDKLKNLFKNSFSPSLPSSTSTSRESASTSDTLNANVPQISTQANLVETLQISGRFAQSILLSLAGCVDANPAKTAFNILNVIIDVRKVSIPPASNWLVLKNVSHFRKSTITRMNCRQFLKKHWSFSARCSPKWRCHPIHKVWWIRRLKNIKGRPYYKCISQFVSSSCREISEQLEKIQTINKRLHSNVFHQVDYENYKVQLTDISRKIGGATNRFNVRTYLFIGVINCSKLGRLQWLVLRE